MKWLSRTMGIAVLGAITAVPSVAAPRVVIRRPFVARRVIVRPYIRPYAFYGPRWYGWGPGFYYPAWGPRYVQPATGEVKIDTHLKDASLYVDGGFVGPVNKFKKFDLRPGSHRIEIRDPAGHTIFNQTINVLLNKTTELHPAE